MSVTMAEKQVKRLPKYKSGESAMGTDELAFLRDRVSRIEGGYEHLATKADLKDLENRLMRTLIGVVAVATTIIIAVQRLWP